MIYRQKVSRVIKCSEENKKRAVNQLSINEIQYRLFFFRSQLFPIADGKKITFANCHFFTLLNKSYLTYSCIIFTLKMESVPKNTIFGLKMMVKSGLDKSFWNSFMADTIFSYFIKVFKITNSVIKITIIPHGWISKYLFLEHFSP